MTPVANPIWTYPTPLTEVRLVGRRKRFFADVEAPDGRAFAVHCANPGRMTSCGAPGSRARISDSGNPKRTLRWSLEQVAETDAWVMVHTARTNPVVEALVAAGRVPGVPADAPRRREAADGAGHRFDLLVEPEDAPRLWIEVKNVTWRVGDEARFPDAVTARGRRHLEGLADRVALGDRALLVFYVGRGDVDRVRPAEDVDPAYAAALRHAVEAGVEVVALAGRVTAAGLDATGTLPVVLGATPPIPGEDRPTSRSIRPVTSASPALRIRDLRHAFPSPEGGALAVLDVPELDLAAGERLVVRGASGGGKTTLLHLVAGILPVQHGTLEVAGTSLAGLGEAARDRFRARHVGYLFQAFHLLPQLTALENVAVALAFQGVRPAAARQAAAQSLERVGLADRRRHRPHQLSVGQQQRVAIARALVGHPSLVLADEPTSSLDPERATEALELLEAFAAERGAALLTVTHDPAVVARAPRVYTLEPPRTAEVAR